MFRIVGRAIAFLAVLAGIVFGVWWALEVTPAEVKIVGDFECKLSDFSYDNYSLVVTSKAGTDRAYPLSTIKEELPDAEIVFPEKLALDEDEKDRLFEITYKYRDFEGVFIFKLKRGTFDTVDITFDGQVIDELKTGNSAAVNTVYDGKTHGIDFIGLPKGTSVDVYDAKGNAVENFKDGYVDAGIYLMKIVLKRDSYLTTEKTLSLKIDRKRIEPSLKVNEFEYDGNPAEIEENLFFIKDGKKFECDPKNYIIQITKIDSNLGETLVDAAVEIGNYRLKVTVDEGSNYTFTPYEKDITVYKEYRVTFRQNSAPDVVKIVRHGDTVTAPAFQNIKGYKFEGWDWGERSPSEPVTCDFTVTANVTLIEYNITFVIGEEAAKYIDMEAWALREDIPTKYTVENVSQIVLPIPEMKVREGDLKCYFDGWYLNSKAVTMIPDNTVGDIVLEAEAYEIYVYTYTVDGVEKTVQGRQPTIYNIDHIDKTDIGYRFTGWTVTDANGDELTQNASFPYTVNGNGLQFTSNYVEIEYIIYFRGEKQDYMPSHPTVPVSYLKYTVNDAVDLSNYTASYPNCDFKGWVNANGEAVTNISAGTVGDIQLSAKWEQHKVNVKYVSNDADNVNNLPENHVLNYYDVLDIPMNLNRKGYDFLGWSLTEEVDELDGQDKNVILPSSLKLDQNCVVTEEGVHNLTLYAIWGEQMFKAFYSIIADGANAGLPYIDYDVMVGDVLTIIDFGDLGFYVEWTDPVSGKNEYMGESFKGKLFCGWKILGDESGTVYDPGDEYDVVSEDVTFIPVWEFRWYSIGFNANTDDISLSGNLPVWENENDTRYTNQLVIPESTLKRQHYNLVGWSLKPDAKPGDIGVIRVNDKNAKFEVPNSNATLYAVWAPKIYTVTFDYANEEGELFSKAWEYNTKLYIDGRTIYVELADGTTEPVCTPTNVGYTFDFWYIDSGEEVAMDDVYAIEGNVTLKCRWTGDERKIIFNTGFGDYDEIGTPITCHSGETVTLPECNTKRYFHNFVGWYDEVTGTTYKPGDYVMPGISDYELVLTAKWAYREYTIQFNTPEGAKTGTKFKYSNLIAGGGEYSLTYAMMELTGTYIFKGWKDNQGNEITAITDAALRSLDDNEKTVYEVNVDIEVSEGFSFESVQGGYAITGYNAGSVVKLPTHHNGKAVVAINTGAFAGQDIVSVAFAAKNNITSIKFGAFLNCKSLTAITIPENVVNIDGYAFSGANLALVINCKVAVKPDGFAANWNATGDNSKPEFDVNFNYGQ